MTLPLRTLTLALALTLTLTLTLTLALTLTLTLTLPLRRSDSPWGSLLPISILIFFGGFMCQMYNKSQRAGGGGGLGGRGNP